MKRLAAHPALVAPEETPIIPPVPVDVAEPILLLGSPLGGPEVLVVDPEVLPPQPPAAGQTLMAPARPLAWGVTVAFMTATIIGGLQFGYSLNGWVAQTREQRNVARQSVEDSPRDLGLAETSPPRRGAEWNPSAAPGHAPRAVSREPVSKIPTPTAAEGRVWPRLTALMGEGIRLHREGWYGPATARFREAVAVMPDYLRAYLWLGRSGLKAGRYDEARRALHQVIVLDPESVAAQEAEVLLSQIDKDN